MRQVLKNILKHTRRKQEFFVKPVLALQSTIGLVVKSSLNAVNAGGEPHLKQVP